MPFRITIDEVIDQSRAGGDAAIVIKRYEQTVDECDLRAVMAAVNKRPRKSRAKKTDDKS